MAKSTALANAILDATLNNGATGTVVIGALTLTLPLRCKFLSTLSSNVTAGTEWATSGSYVAGGVTLAGLFATAAATGSKANTGAVNIASAPAGTWAGCEIVDSTGTPVRLNFGPAISLGKAINAGDPVVIPVGGLVGTEV